MARQHFFVGKSHLGSRDLQNFRQCSWRGNIPVESWAYFCQSCGDIWARLIVEGGSNTQVRARPCPAHGDGTLALLCKFEWWETELSADWPIDALRRELLLELDKASSTSASGAPF